MFCIIAIIAVVVFASFVKLWPYNMSLTLANFDVNISSGYKPIWTTLYVSLVAAVVGVALLFCLAFGTRSEEHTSELQSLMRISYAVFVLKKKNRTRRTK